MYNNVSAEARQSILEGAGVPAGFAAVLVDVDNAIGRGRLATTNGELSRLIGRPTTPLRDSLTVALKS